MNTKTLLTAATLSASLLFSTAAFANFEAATDSEVIYTDAFSSESAAYNAGFAVIDQLSDASQSELRTELHAYGADIRDLNVENTTVHVQKFATAPDNIQYRAVIDVDYSFQERQDNND
ncbi:DUF3316 domain-containing protein [Reinekea thalattae]|uniref:DUF3316 domain-containing protein n=1 Tax=Reinekea thalattae TaxID=2593301 RepID=A0A5C8Z419_9GAMM|nr:DUF3316 domain-containing protein [Reinekea thalattae]TXR51921.1 DUF3316 domain-containing protein [Reinekea thalattae]